MWGLTLLHIPLEELAFAFFFSLCCNGIHLHLLWNRYGRHAGEPA